MRPNLWVFDDVFSDFENIKDLAGRVTYGEIAAPDGRTYRDVYVFDQLGTLAWSEIATNLTGLPLISTLAGLRRNSPETTDMVGAIHSDLGYGDYASVLFVSAAPSDSGQTGTAFWRHKATGLEASPDNHVPEEIANDYSRPDAWEMTGFVAAKPNRLLIYPALNFHSRYPFTGYSGGDMGARVVSVAFYNLIREAADDTESDE